MTAAEQIGIPHPRPKLFGRRAALVLVLVAALSQVLLFGGVYSWSWVPAQILLLTGIALISIGASWRGQKLPWHPLLFPAAGFGLLVLLQWAAHWSVYPALTLTGLLQLSAGGAALYLSLYAFSSLKNLRVLSTSLWLFTGLVAIEALVQYFEANGRIYWFKYVQFATPVGPFVYHNFYAGMMELLLPLCSAAALWPISGKQLEMLARTRRCAFPALALASFVVAQSRGGLFTLVFEALLAILLFWKQIRSARGGFKRLALIVLCFLAFSSLASWGPLLTRLQRLEHHASSAIDRVKMTEACVRIWRDHVWIGSGFGTFPTIYPAYETFDNSLNWAHAHNDWAQALAETGLVGALFILAFVALLLWVCWPRGHARLSRTQIYGRACVIGLAGFMFHSAGDFLFHSPGLMLLFFVLVGAAVGASRAKPEPKRAEGAGAIRAPLAVARAGYRCRRSVR